VAPPGYGKSTLLAQWAELDDRTFLHLTLDGGQGPQAIRSLAQQLEAEAWVGEVHITKPPGDARARLWAAIQLVLAFRGSFVLVLDDADLVDRDLLAEVLDLALRALPESCTLAVASRTEPPIPLGSLRASRALTEIRGDDLALSPAEAAELVRREGLRLEFEALQDLVRRTEGWPVGLYLAALSLRHQDSLEVGLEHFGGNDHRVAEYFRDEVLSSARPEMVRFALRTAVLDELTGPACDAVLQTSGSSTILAKLAGLNPFLVPLDESHDTFRWHRMFREALLSELRRAQPKLLPQLNLRASAWFEARGDIDRAIHHAAWALDAELVSRLLWPNILRYVGCAQDRAVRQWLGRFSPGDLAAHPALALSAAYSKLANGQFEYARYWATVARAASDTINSPDRSVSAGLAAIESVLSQDTREMTELAETAAGDQPVDSPLLPVAWLIGATAKHLSGDHDAAQPLLDRAWELGAVTAPVISLLSLAQSNMIALEQRDYDVAGELTDRAEAVIRRHQLADCPIMALASAASAASRAHEGRADEAKQLLRRAANLLERSDDFLPWYGAEVRLLMAHASLWLADVVSARTLLAEASRLARRTTGVSVFETWFDEAWRYIDTLAETSLVGPSSLTIAELRVLRFLPSHRSFREIGSQLGVSANTIKTQAHAIYRKLGVASRSEAVEQASAAGLLGQ
jgi:LuxR family maltose regulon positive regulatory protein